MRFSPLQKVGKAVEWDEARPTLEEDKRFAALASEEERKRIFGEFVEELKQRVRAGRHYTLFLGCESSPGSVSSWRGVVALARD